MAQKNLKYKLNKYSTFIKLFLKKGKIQRTKKLINNAFIKLSKETNLALNHVFIKMLYSLYTYIEVKNVRIKRRLSIIPFSTRKNRRNFLVLQKIRKLLKKKHISISSNLYLEILNILKRPAKYKDIRNLNTSQAYSNRSNTHYRWFF